MKPMQLEFLSDMDELASTSMDIDEVDPNEFFGEGVLNLDSSKFTDDDFFNNFEDDFDDNDII